jgi:hypothetical protein
MTFFQRPANASVSRQENAYRDNLAALLARVEGLEHENARLRHRENARSVNKAAWFPVFALMARPRGVAIAPLLGLILGGVVVAAHGTLGDYGEASASAGESRELRLPRRSGSTLRSGRSYGVRWTVQVRNDAARLAS